jgi:hypothetical protein
LYSHGSPVVSREEWARFLARNALRSDKYPFSDFAHTRAQSVVPGFVFGPVLRFGTLEMARWFAFAIFCVGFVGLARALRRAFPSDERSEALVTSTLALCALAMPILAYVKLLYPEVLLFALVAWAAVALLEEKPYLATVLAWLLPIVHIRTLALAAGIVAIVLVQAAARSQRRERLQSVIAFVVVLVLAFVTIQLRLYGTLTGPAFATTHPSIALALQRLGMQLFDGREGLLTYAPVYVFAFAGLTTGALRRDRVCVAALALLALYILTFMWATASESWPARYWVAVVPLLAIGLLWWLRSCTTRLDIAVLAPVIIVGITNTVLFAMQPAWYLEGRRVSVAYAVAYRVTHVDFGMVLPVDGGGGFPVYAEPVPLLLALTFALVCVLALSRLAVRERLRSAFGGAALVLVLVPFFACASRTLPRDRYAVSADVARGAIAITLRAPADVRAVQLDSALPLPWETAAYPRALRVRCANARHRVTESRAPSRALILTPNCIGATSIRILADPPGPTSGFERALDGVTVLQPIVIVTATRRFGF